MGTSNQTLVIHQYVKTQNLSLDTLHISSETHKLN